jgi:hypothetical protein
MSFDIFFGMFLYQWAWKLTAASAVAEILSVEASFNFTFQTGFAFAVIAYQTACTWILVFFTADAINSTWGQ